MSEKLSALTVAELKTLCTELGIAVASKARKQEIVDAIVSHKKDEDIPSGVIVPLTPRKSMLTPRKSRRHGTNEPGTPREARHKLRDELIDECKENQESPGNLIPKTGRQTRSSSRRALEVLDDAVEATKPELPEKNDGDLHNEVADRARTPTEEPSENADEAESIKTEPMLAEDVGGDEDQQAMPEAEKIASTEDTGVDEARKTNHDTTITLVNSPTSFLSAHSTHAEEVFLTPTKKIRKRWDTPTSMSFEFAEDPSGCSPPGNLVDEDGTPEGTVTVETGRSSSLGTESPSEDASGDCGQPPTADAGLAKITEENIGPPEEVTRVSVEGETQPIPNAVGQSSQSFLVNAPKLAKDSTFIVDTPSKFLNSKKLGISSASKPAFKASKTPNFKKIHERNQANMENISEYSARKRDRMRNLLAATREIRNAGNASRKSSGKTPSKNVREAMIHTPSSARKILSDKVRTNRRFELLMKSRGLPTDDLEEVADA